MEPSALLAVVIVVAIFAVIPAGILFFVVRATNAEHDIRPRWRIADLIRLGCTFFFGISAISAGHYKLAATIFIVNDQFAFKASGHGHGPDVRHPLVRTMDRGANAAAVGTIVLAILTLLMNMLGPHEPLGATTVPVVFVLASVTSLMWSCDTGTFAFRRMKSPP
ncbi:hypothetical protein [Nitrogeniibacter aestuarii]|uniref:hypothetical protein n=1 Tax=Nitrogeniibacter aestuarii TaxID=2815343 RepID=UPI001D122A72|nr:hypothetical protein [Nitrogeniibacter aestuarii]